MNTSHQVEICTEFPPQVNSGGVWVHRDSRLWFMSNTMPVLQMQISLIFCMTQAFHFFLKRFGLPRLASQIITGLVLGTSFSKTWAAARDSFFTYNTQEVLGMISLFGYALFRYLMAVKMDVGLIRKTGRKAFAIGVISLVVPLICGMLVDHFVAGSHLLNRSESDKLPIIISMHALTSFPVIYCLLNDLKILNSELGRLSISSALISDILSVAIVVVFALTRVWKDIDHTKAYIEFAGILAYVVVVVFVIRPAMFWVIRKTPEGMPVKDVYIYVVIILVLFSGTLANWADQRVVIGPYILGLATPEGPPLGSTLVNKFDIFVSDFLLPIFVTTCALRVDLASISFSFKDNVTYTNTILVFVTFLAKFGACLVPTLSWKMPFKDSLTIALIMSCKGHISIAVYSFLRDYNTLNEESFGLLVLSVLFAAIIVPFLVKFLYNPSRKYAGYEKRDIMHLKPNSELRILACIHRPGNIPAVINLLDASCPTREDPIMVYVLHLIEQIGRASPIFISHQMQKKTVGNTSYSENVIVSFGHFERNSQGAVSVNAFTTISPHKFMHEDICTLALDKLTSLIILPFHRKWSMEGTVESEDNTIRTLTCSVLDIAPCSVAIFVDRGHFGSTTSMVSSVSAYCVCMIFLGGKDDLEALTYAKRSVKDPCVSLTVMRLLAQTENEDTDWESIIADEVIKDFQKNIVGYNEHVKYIEEAVKDGTHTARKVRSIVNDYDLIIVGRRHGIESPHTSGLGEWSTEFSELGVIGDLLASTDLNSRASVLVVQQQKMN